MGEKNISYVAKVTYEMYILNEEILKIELERITHFLCGLLETHTIYRTP